jgi:hypothetical protein
MVKRCPITHRQTIMMTMHALVRESHAPARGSHAPALAYHAPPYPPRADARSSPANLLPPYPQLLLNGLFYCFFFFFLISIVLLIFCIFFFCRLLSPCHDVV